MLAERGALVIDADAVGHAVYEPGTDAWQAVVRHFGDGVVAPDGTIDRAALGRIVFADPEALASLNAIVHPAIGQAVRGQVADARAAAAPLVVVEAALLFEAGWDGLVDEIWVTDAPEDIAIQRVSTRSGLAPEEVRQRMARQMPQQERLRRADVVLDTDRDLHGLEAAVHALLDERGLLPAG